MAAFDPLSSLSSLALEPQAEGLDARLRRAREDGDQDQLREAAQQFEAILVNWVFKAMRKTADLGEGSFSGGEMDTWYGMLDQELSTRISEQGGLGLAQSLERSIRSYGRPELPSSAGDLSGVGALTPPPARVSANRRSLRWPLPAAAPQHVSSDYGQRRDPLRGVQRQHDGLDLAAAEGTPILAAEAGVVARVGDDPGYGRFVDVDHGEGLVTRYAHQRVTQVAVGQRVAAGQPLGEVGSTGRSTGPHLHIEVRLHGEAVDPKSFFRERP